MCVILLSASWNKQNMRRSTLAIPSGLPKFNELNGILWKEVYRYGGTVIYEVIP